MTAKINISIPQPCHENWEAMTVVDKGKFCNSCQKNVFDFTSATDREIINAFERDNHLCGRFLNTQLNRDLIKPKEKSSLWLATTTALISLIGVYDVAAQGKAKIEQTDKKVLTDEVASKDKGEIKISGIVTDSISPLPGVNVIIKGTSISTQTDFDGKYSIVAIKGDQLIFSYLGMKTQAFNIEQNSKEIYVRMKSSDIKLSSGIVVLTNSKKRTFFGRLFHKSKYR